MSNALILFRVRGVADGSGLVLVGGDLIIVRSRLVSGGGGLFELER